MRNKPFVKVLVLFICLAIMGKGWAQNDSLDLDPYQISKAHIIKYAALDITQLEAEIKPHDFDLSKKEEECSYYYSFGLESERDVVMISCPPEQAYFSFIFNKESDTESDLNPLSLMLKGFKEELKPNLTETEADSDYIQYDFSEGDRTYSVYLYESATCIEDYENCLTVNVVISWFDL